MIGRILAVLATACFLVGVAPAASAHEGRPAGDGDLHMTVGFGTEPAYAGQPNSVQLILEHGGRPVVDLGNTLDVEVVFGDQSMALPLEPNFAVGAFGEPGDYRAWFIPTRPGQYEFHFTGTIDGERVDESFTSGPDTFSDVQDPSDVEFPVEDPTTGELAERIDREIPRINDAIDQARGELAADVDAVADDAASASTFGMIGIAVGALGLIVAVMALAAVRRGRPA